VTVCLFSACGDRHTAISLAEDFIDANATMPQQMEHRDFGKLGTTRLLNDSLVSGMRSKPGKFYKSGIDYPDYHQGDTLYFIRMSFVCQGDSLSQTFYIDKQLKHVVAVK
jgi:hypothetical protein